MTEPPKATPVAKHIPSNDDVLISNLTGSLYVNIDEIISFAERTYLLALSRTYEEARLAASFCESYRMIKAAHEAEELFDFIAKWAIFS